MKYLFLPLLLLSLLLAAVGCGESNGPVDTAESFLQALNENDLDTVKALGCSQRLDKYVEFVERNIRMKTGVEYDVDCSLESEQGDHAVVRIQGVSTFHGLGENGEQSRDVDGRVDMVREEGRWKYCVGTGS